MKAGWGSDGGEDAIEELESDFDVFLMRKEWRSHVLASASAFRIRGQIGEEVMHHSLLVDGPKDQMMPIAVDETPVRLDGTIETVIKVIFFIQSPFCQPLAWFF